MIKVGKGNSIYRILFTITFVLFSCSKNQQQSNENKSLNVSLEVGGVYVVDQGKIKFNSSQKKYGLIKILYYNQDKICYRTFKNTFETLPTEDSFDYNFDNDYVVDFGSKAIGVLSERIGIKEFFNKFSKKNIKFISKTELSSYDQEVLNENE